MTRLQAGHCEERSDEAIPWIDTGLPRSFQSLAMTGGIGIASLAMTA